MWQAQTIKNKRMEHKRTLSKQIVGTSKGLWSFMFFCVLVLLQITIKWPDDEKQVRKSINVWKNFKSKIGCENLDKHFREMVVENFELKIGCEKVKEGEKIPISNSEDKHEKILIENQERKSRDM